MFIINRLLQSLKKQEPILYVPIQTGRPMQDRAQHELLPKLLQSGWVIEDNIEIQNEGIMMGIMIFRLQPPEKKKGGIAMFGQDEPL